MVFAEANLPHSDSHTSTSKYKPTPWKYFGSGGDADCTSMSHSSGGNNIAGGTRPLSLPDPAHSSSSSSAGQEAGSSGGNSNSSDSGGSSSTRMITLGDHIDAIIINDYNCRKEGDPSGIGSLLSQINSTSTPAAGFQFFPFLGLIYLGRYSFQPINQSAIFTIWYKGVLC